MSYEQNQSQSQTPFEENKLTPQASPVDGETETTPSADPLADIATNGEDQPVGTDPADIDVEDEEDDVDVDSEDDLEEE
ncbi:hypothetical protein [Asticcacaulis sp. YBE204]|uniref:hypothetical protein n=1 Tax=Asticcacaulis sp. YBE204 TaxID=1282363 RepID=UPI0003C3F3E2|nr:hypothetical protein [Asticcacaulis sp. YBE204]ESQ78725.1 hypothetical protein AEYBE204_12125 [Asticcacaulis sp. YBE204]